MPEGIFATIYGESVTMWGFLAASATALVLGIAVAWTYTRTVPSSTSMAKSLALLPFLVQIVILLVNGNLGAGVAVAGTFSLVRFRSAPGTAQDITAVFLAMAVGLACGMGYLGLAAFGALLVCLLNLIYGAIAHPKEETNRELKITIPENLDYAGLFDDLFEQYTQKVQLMQVKTTNLGSMYSLCYRVQLKNVQKEKEFLDHLRCRNGNLEIVCGRIPTDVGRDAL